VHAAQARGPESPGRTSGRARIVVARPRLNADNAAMIARAGWFHLSEGRASDLYLDADPTLPWPGLERDPEPHPTKR
jgi:tRNA A37 threonylcarbamoyltransferase TsaD